MPRALKSDKFYFFKVRGYRKGGPSLLGVNNSTGGISVQDLLDFLKEKGIEPAKVPLPSSFVTRMEP